MKYCNIKIVLLKICLCL